MTDIRPASIYRITFSGPNGVYIKGVQLQLFTEVRLQKLSFWLNIFISVL